MNKIIIPVIIGLVAVGAILFTNADDLAFSEIDEITSEIKFENPIQSYEINTKCELMLIHLSAVDVNGAAFPVNEQEVQELVKKMMEDAERNAEKMDFENIRPEEMEELGLKAMEKANNTITDYVMEYNSINPKFRNYVHEMLQYTAVGENRQTIMEFYDFMPNDYIEDIECGKKLHEKYSDKLYDFTKSAYGESTAEKRQTAIKSALYD